MISTQKYSSELRKHRQFLAKFKLFPTKTRKVIYCTLMALPMNHSHFLELTKPFKQLPEHTSNRQAAFIVNALVKLYPSLGVQWLPGLVYPFVKLFEEDSIMCFESSLTFLLNWYQPLFENYPNPSKRIISLAKKILPNLDKKVSSFNYSLGAVLNPIFLVCLTDILNKDDFLQLLDFLVTNPYSPQLFLCSALAIVSLCQDQLCQLSTVEQISIALRKQKKLNMSQVIQTALQLSQTFKKQLQSIYTKSIFPLNTQRYPIFQFIKPQPTLSNQSIEKLKYEQMNTLQHKYSELESLISQRLKEGTVANQYQIEARYSDMEAQTVQYLNKVKREHQMKLKALKQIEEQFKQEIYHEEQASKSSMNQKKLTVIQRRGRLQKEILKLQQQAKKIRQLQQDLLNRIDKITEIRKNQIMDQNKKLQHQQRSQQLYSRFYEA